MPEREARRASDQAAEAPDHDLGVIVPTVLGAGLLVSIAVYLRDLAHRWRGEHPLHRRHLIEGRATARMTAAGTAAARRDQRTLRPRWVYALAAVVLLGLAVYLVPGSYGNFAGWTSWAHDIGWLWVVFIVASMVFGWVGAAALAVAVRWQQPPAWARRALAATPLTNAPEGDLAIGKARHGASAPRLSDDTVRWLHRLAELWGGVAVVTFGTLTVMDRIPRPPEGDILGAAVSRPVVVVALTMVVIGLAIGRRFTATGAVLIAVAAATLGLLSSVQYRPSVAMGVTFVFAVPAVIEWYAWQHRRSLQAIAVLAVTTTVLLIGVGAAADTIYDHYWGPAHPASSIAALPDSETEWVWAGATTEQSTRVVAKVRGGEGTPVRLLVSERADLGDGRWSEPTTVDDVHVAHFDVRGLSPDTEYHYALEVDGTVDTVRQGHIRTFPVGPASYRMAFGACARTGSNGAVYDAIRERDPLAYVALGDIHYANIDRNDPSAMRDALDAVLTSPSQSALYRSTSTAYVWDDHDYGGNDADANSVSRPAAQLVYRQYAPHNLLAAGESGGIYQSFEVGRLRYLLTDTRSYRDASAASGPTLLGAEQLAWFDAELRRAAADGVGVVWLSPTPWIGEANPASDTWAGFDAERRQIADLIDELGLADRMILVAGDAHMVALDDGSNSDYSSRRGGGFPVLQAAALDRPGSTKGGPFSEGMFPGAGQFGEIDVDDRGGPRIGVTMRGFRYTGETIVEHHVDLDLTR
jgi:hypothetical protein